MPWRTEWINPELAFVCYKIGPTPIHQTIRVYHCYKNHESDSRLTYWYTLNYDGLDSWGDPTSVHQFDIREFATYDETLSHREILQQAIDNNLCTIEDIFIHIERAHHVSHDQ